MSPFPETNDPKVLIIVFGLPGAGKTYVGRILQECFGFFFYDGDNDLPDRMRAAIAAQAPIDDAMRDVFFARIVLSIRRLQPEHNRLVVGQTCIKEKYRRLVFENFPEARFILVEADKDVRDSRLVRRAANRLASDYFRSMALIFEASAIPHEVIVNNIDGKEEIRRQAAAILEKWFPED